MPITQDRIDEIQAAAQDYIESICPPDAATAHRTIAALCGELRYYVREHERMTVAAGVGWALLLATWLGWLLWLVFS